MNLQEIALAVVSLFLAAACFAEEAIPENEQDARNGYLHRKLTITGSVIAADGAPLANATVELGDKTTTTGGHGEFSLTEVRRGNYLVHVGLPGFRTEILPVTLNRAKEIAAISLPPVVLDAQDPRVVRMLFGGDVAFGRRFLDPEELIPRDQIPPDNPDALIQVSDPEPGTRRVMQYLRPYYQEADWGSLNFESPVTDNPMTPHPTKDFAFFTLPGSLPALQWLGVDYVGLGNNHVFDYQDNGIRDTVAHLRQAGIPFSGAGLNSTEAFEAYTVPLGGTPYAFLAMTSISGGQHNIDYVANATKGGAADLSNTAAVTNAIQREAQRGAVPIAQFHSGFEYTFEPSEHIVKQLQRMAESGAALLIGHHPHVAQGVGLTNGVFALHSLGNLAFDQARLETMLGMLARVDMRGREVRSLRLLPVYLEDFRPRPIAGRLAAALLRRIGEFSHGYGVLVYPYQGQGWVALGPDSAHSVDRTVEVEVTVPSTGIAVVDLRASAQDEESLASARINADASIQVGRDIMNYGDFEDWDVDEEIFEAARWDLAGASRFVCLTKAYRGVAGLCSTRSEYSTVDSVVPFRNRVRVMGDALNTPNKDLSFLGYISGQNAGAIKIIAKYYASEEIGNESRVFAEEEVAHHPGGTFPWVPVVADLHMPPDDPEQAQDPSANARALRVFFRHSPVAKGKATAAFDDIAIINWEEVFAGDGETSLATPHARDFLRVKAAPGSYRLSLNFRAYRPAALN